MLLKLAGLGVTVEPDYSYRGFSTGSPRCSTLVRSRCSSRCPRSPASTRCGRRTPRRSRPGWSAPAPSTRGAVTGRTQACRGRRPWRDDRAARHGRRSRASLPARSRAGRHRPRRPARRRVGARRSPGSDPNRAARHRAGGHPRRLARPAGPARHRARPRPSCRSGSPAGRPAPTAATPSSAAATSCSPGSTARSTRTATATRTTPFASCSSALSEPYAAFTDGPEAQAVQGALELDTLVVAPAGNDGAAGPVFGSVGGPGGGAGRARGRGRRLADATAEGARRRFAAASTSILDRKLPLIGAAAPAHALVLRVGTPWPPRRRRDRGRRLLHAHGLSRVAGRRRSSRTGADPAAQVAAAAAAGAAAVVFYGTPLAAGGLRLDESPRCRSVCRPPRRRRAAAAACAGLDVAIAIGAAGDAAERRSAGSPLLLARGRLRRRPQAEPRRSRRRDPDGGAGHRGRRDCALRDGERDERLGRDRRRRRGAARPDAPEPRRPGAPEPARGYASGGPRARPPAAASCVSARRPSARWRPSRRRSDSASGRLALARRPARSSSATPPPAASGLADAAANGDWDCST